MSEHDSKSIEIVQLLSSAELLIGKSIKLSGWITSIRLQKEETFLVIRDGSTIQTIQVICSGEKRDLLADLTTGSALSVLGIFKESPPSLQKPGQPIQYEIQMESIEIHGLAAPDYPYQKAAYDITYLRRDPDLKPRTRVGYSIQRIKSSVYCAIVSFFHQNGFIYTDLPMITRNSCEGGANPLQVTALLGNANDSVSRLPRKKIFNGLSKKPSEKSSEKPSEKSSEKPSEKTSEESSEKTSEESSEKTSEESSEKSSEESSEKSSEESSEKSSEESSEKTSEESSEKPESEVLSDEIDYSNDFFGERSFMTVSNQFGLEAFAAAHRKVFTFTIATRGEPSLTYRHLAHFTMLEWETYFSTLNDNMQIAESLIKCIASIVLKECAGELGFLSGFFKKDLRASILKLSQSEFIHITHREAVEKLLDAVTTHANTQKGKKKPTKLFLKDPSYDDDISAEHERYLVKHINQGIPTFVTHFPAHVKAFYMPETVIDSDCISRVENYDLLMGLDEAVTEVAGGSQRIYRTDELLQRMKRIGVPESGLESYIKLARMGNAPHGGAGIGFERLCMFFTGVDQIVDLATYPVTVKKLWF
jgi:asparaginyl-tRNA synthetase